MRGRLLLASAAALVGSLGWSEFVHWRAAKRRLGTEIGRPSSSEAVVVLGFRNRGDRANYLNRYRVRAGLRSLDPKAARSVLVLCGGGVAGHVPEAELMARYARAQRGYRGPIRCDPRSTNTWENIRSAIPLVEDVDAIKVVSDPVHAEKGRAHLWMQRPDLAGRLRPADEYRFGEIALVKPLAAVIGLRKLARLRSARHRLPRPRPT